MAAVQTRLLTAEQFFQLPPGECPSELVRGIVVTKNVPGFRHGLVCGQVNFYLAQFVRKEGLGHVLCNGAEVVTQRNPDTVRAADVAYYSHERWPKGTEPEVYSGIAPELLFEVLSPEDRWSEILVKIGEYLEVGVRAVCIADPDSESVKIFRGEQAPQTFREDEEFSVPDVLAGWKLPVSRFFDD